VAVSGCLGWVRFGVEGDLLAGEVFELADELALSALVVQPPPGPATRHGLGDAVAASLLGGVQRLVHVAETFEGAGWAAAGLGD